MSSRAVILSRFRPPSGADGAFQPQAPDKVGPERISLHVSTVRERVVFFLYRKRLEPAVASVTTARVVVMGKPTQRASGVLIGS